MERREFCATACFACVQGLAVHSQRCILFGLSARSHPELVPWNHVQDPVPAVHWHTRQQSTLVRLCNQEHGQRSQFGRRGAPRMRDGGPIPKMFFAKMAALLEDANLPEGGNGVEVYRHFPCSAVVQLVGEFCKDADS